MQVHRVAWQVTVPILLTFTSCGLSATAVYDNESRNAASRNDWAVYHGDLAGTHYSRLSDVNTRNVHRLEIAWSYDTGESSNDVSPVDMGAMESNPLVVSGKLYFTTQNGRLICLDAESGAERWAFNPDPGRQALGTMRGSRGVALWSEAGQRRIVFVYKDALYLIDAEGGTPVTAFGEGGRISLKTGIDRDPSSFEVGYRSPPLVYEDLIIVGSSGNVPGDIRAFDARTGRLRWTFHTIPRPGEFGSNTWPEGAWRTAIGANCWAGITADTRRGILYVPLAFPQTYYGADRVGDNLFANSVVALDARTGQRIWHFQTIRHDIWDRDLPAPPTLVTVVRHGRDIPALAQISKQGFVYILNRLTGQPLFPLVEKASFASDVPGEVVGISQIEPVLPAPLVRNQLTEEMLSQRSPEVARAVRLQFASLRSRGLWDPPSEQGTIQFPGMEGGATWGGAAYDPESGLLYVNANEDAWIVRLRKRPRDESSSSGELYRSYCAPCHGDGQARGLASAPDLRGIGNRFSDEDIRARIMRGGAKMPRFGPILASGEIAALVTFLKTGQDAATDTHGTTVGLPKDASTEYLFDGYSRFLDPEGYPAIQPPWGTLSAIDVSTGRYVWKIPLGEYPELVDQGITDTGSYNYGGPIVTAGGLLFIAATAFDNKFRAFDKRTGHLLWQATLPSAGIATPSTYRVNGRQFVVIAAGGGKNPRQPSGSKLVAFALSRK